MKRVGMNTFTAVVRCLSVVVFMLPLQGAAQTRATGGKVPPLIGYKLTAVKVKGSSRYTDKEILAASGLVLGQDAADGDFREAAQRLGNSGIFSNVAYSFSYSSAGIKLEFEVTDTDQSKFVPVIFENFVWFSDAELLTDLRRRVPLFKEGVPLSGRLLDQVAEALQALLGEKHLPGRVDFIRATGQESGGFKGIEYRVADVTLRIGDLEFPGASPEQSGFLKAAGRRIPGAPYSRSAIASVAKFDLLPQYLQRGYLKASFGTAEARVVTQPPAQSGAPASDDVEVDAIVPVTPGKQYAVSDVTLKGNSAVSNEEAVHLFHLPVGKPADGVRVTLDAENLVKLYHSRGYMTAQVNPEARIDEDKSTVSYNLKIDERALYKMGELEIVGVDSQSKDRLREAWKLREGEPYNGDYKMSFLDGVRTLLPSGLHFTVQVSEDLDAKSKSVDVTIHFKTQ
jgi:outer membrane protein assembly factor BamA